MLPIFKQIDNQTWEYVDKLDNTAVIALIEDKVQEDHVLITLDGGPHFERIKTTVEMPNVCFDAVNDAVRTLYRLNRKHTTMTSESCRNGKRTKTQNNSVT